MFRKPTPETLKAGYLTQRVSRCSVCTKKRYSYEPPTPPSEITRLPSINGGFRSVQPPDYTRERPVSTPYKRPVPPYRPPSSDRVIQDGSGRTRYRPTAYRRRRPQRPQYIRPLEE